MTLTASALALIVGGALAYSLLDLLRKVLVRDLRPAPLLFFLSVGMLPFFAAWTALEGGFRFGPGYLAPGIASVVLNIAANLAFFEAVRLSPLSRTIPFLSFTPVFTTLLAAPLLGEVPGPVELAGIALVVFGALRLNLGRGERGTLGALWRAFRGEPGSLLMTGVALLWSLAMPLDKLAMTAAPAPFHGLVLNAGVAAGVLALLGARGRWAELRPPSGSWPALGGAVVAGVAGLGFMLLAINLVWVGLVETLKRAIGSSLAVVLGRTVFAEPITANKLIGVAVMTAGVALILL